MLANIGAALKPGFIRTGGSSPNLTGSSPQISSGIPLAGGPGGTPLTQAQIQFLLGNGPGAMNPANNPFPQPGGGVRTGGSSPNLTGSSPQISSAPAGSMFGLPKPAAPVAPAAPQTSTALHASGLPNQPPSGISPQLWSSVLQHLQSTNFGRPQPRMQIQPVQAGAPSPGAR